MFLEKNQRFRTSGPIPDEDGQKLQAWLSMVRSWFFSSYISSIRSCKRGSECKPQTEHASSAVTQAQSEFSKGMQEKQESLKAPSEQVEIRR